MSDHDFACALACEIVNAADRAGCKAEAFFRILHLILAAMAEMAERRVEPSEN